MDPFPRPRPVLILDVMDTLVRDPFFNGMAEHLGFASFEDFVAAKKDGTWVAFESGRMGEAALAKEFFADPARELDVPAFKDFLRSSYELLPGVERLLASCRASSIECHAFSNYPIWYVLVEEKLRLERDHGVRWTFVSACEGVRKPDAAAYHRVARNACAAVDQCVLLDDRQENCDAAVAAGFHAAVKFEDAGQAMAELRRVYAPTRPI
jgi:FMN hydrolase / 5-amino-6-(5-phospho-D-ribitylamino)uracil phosphatase